MAVTYEPAETLADVVKHDLKTSTTSQSTLNILRALLGLELQEAKSNDIRKASVREPAKLPGRLPTKPTRPKPAATRTRTKPDFKVHDGTRNPTQALPLDRRRILATETFNITLKQLSDKSKEKQNAGNTQVTETPAAGHTSPQKPLQARSPNRKPFTVSEEKIEKVLRTERPATEQDGTLEATAACATEALQCLQEMAHESDAAQVHANHLLRGAQILLDKLIALGLTKQAIQQVWKNRDQLCSQLDHSFKRTSAAKGSLSSAMSFDNFQLKAELVNATTAFQFQVLKVGGLVGPAFVDTSFLSFLNPANPSNPASLSVQAVERKTMTEDKAGQYLHGYSAILWNLCSSMYKEKAVCPSHRFQLTIAMLSIRCHSLRLLKRKPDLEKDVWVPLSRALRGHNEVCKADFVLIRQSIFDMQQLIELGGIVNDVPGHITNLLIELAQRSGFTEDARAVLKGTNPTGKVQMDLEGFSNDFRMTTFVLSDTTVDSTTKVNSCEKALNGLKQSLKGTSSEARDLLLQSARLRKAAVVVALEIEKRIQSAQVKQEDVTLQRAVVRLVYGVTRFVFRFTSQMKAQDTIKKGVSDSKESQTAVFNCARSTIDAVLSLVRCTHVRSAVTCEETDAALRDCTDLATLLDSRITIDIQKAPQKQVYQSTHLRISNIYWAWYLQDRDTGLSSMQLCRTLQTSVEALAPCSREERRSGFEVVKCERLASLYQTLGEHDAARISLQRAINASIRQGALNEAVEIVLTGPARPAWMNPNLDSHILGSCLRKLGRISAGQDDEKNDFQTLYFDDESLPDIHRAQVLEIQLFAVAELQANSIRGISKCLAKRTLALCQKPQHHVYRIRFLRDLLNVAAKNNRFPIHEIVDDELIQATCTFQETDSRSSSYLNSYGPLLCLSVLLQWALFTTRPSAECLRRLMDRIASLLFQCRSIAELDVIVDDPDSLLRQLNAAADYAGLLELIETRLCALRAMQHVLQFQREPERKLLLNGLVQIGVASARLGKSFEAGRSFAEVEKLLDKVKDHKEVRLNWRLAYADYLMDLDVYEKSIGMIEIAQADYTELYMEPSDKESGSDRLKQDSCLAHAALTLSCLAFRQGDLHPAIVHARKCIRLTTGLWAALEKLFEGAIERNAAAGIDATQSSVEETLNTSISLDRSVVQMVVKGAPFWKHVHVHFQALLHMSTLSAHCGLALDALYYAGLASKVAAAVTSDQRQTVCQVKLALLHARAGQLVQAKSIFKTIKTSSLAHLPGLHTADAGLDMAATGLILKDLVATKQHLVTVDSYLSQAATGPSLIDSCTASASVTLENQISALTVAGVKAERGVKSRSAATSRRAAPASNTRVQKIEIVPLSSATRSEGKSVSPAIRRLQEARATLATKIGLHEDKIQSHGNVSEANPVLSETSISAPKKLADATWLLSQALAMFGSDAVHCVLAETALAYPSKYNTRRPSGRVSALSATTISTKAKKALTKPRQNTKPNSDLVSTDDVEPEGLLRKAYGIMLSASNADAGCCPSDILHDTQKLFCRLSMLANAVGLSLSYSPVKVVANALKPKDILLARERSIVDTDRMSTDKSELRRWPVICNRSQILPCDSAAEQVPSPMEFDYLPETWSIVSISLNDTKSELLLSRITAGATPLILRIPLSRSAIDDAEENQFTFDEAKEELVDIIAQANLTAHDTRSQGDKASRKLWWAEREALDHRLQTLMLNIENIWLGGFRGILSQQCKLDEQSVSRFRSSLEAALEKHLPSRQKSGAISKQKVQLHAHVLDLFITLGHPDEVELDDAITDLLYFVVDILQFEGERNAYDEIDFDAILVDVLDALRSYHEADSIESKPRHTIVILDKELHAFPWEALPCLLGKSVSRMPSMSMVRHRLAKIRAQSSVIDAYEIASTSGAYILNPSSDLASTEITFSDTFSAQLPRFTSIISRKPTEAEFESLLYDNSLFLYFGHGSGAQYIRGRRIKQLDKCAVSFLMGCSSSKMNECGVFESHGVPWNYMHAGSMAVVGTLWDVTDRDIDRFAISALEEWGLVEGVQEDDKARQKTEARKKKVGRPKPKKGDGRKGKGRVALDEAVNRARDACILRYLNGAAVVIYGLPVMLK